MKFDTQYTRMENLTSGFFRTEHQDAYDRKPMIYMFHRQTMVEIQLYKMLKGRYRKNFHIMTSMDFYCEYDNLELQERKRIALELIGNPGESSEMVRYFVRCLPRTVDSVKIDGDVAEVRSGSDILTFEYSRDYMVWYSTEPFCEDGYSNFLMVLMFNPIKKEEASDEKTLLLNNHHKPTWLPYPSYD